MEKYVEILLDENLKNANALEKLSKQPIPIEGKDGKILTSAYAETIGHVERIHKMIQESQQMDLREKEVEKDILERKEKAEKEENERILRLKELEIRQLEIESRSKSEAEERNLREMELRMKHEEHQADIQKDLEIAKSRDNVDMFTSIGNAIGTAAAAALLGYADSIKVISSNALRVLSKPFTIFKKR